MSQAHLLRPIALRLTSTPVKELPPIAFYLASSLSACLQHPNSGEENTVLLHKIRTRISSLLQHRSKEGRLAAVILIKAFVEAGGRDVLSTVEPWVRGLISILSKPDPAATKRLCILTVTRIFLLTQGYPTLVRELTTPLLPAFSTACLGAIRPREVTTDGTTTTVLSSLLHVVLSSWYELLPRHPSVFRPYVCRFKPICLSLISENIATDDVLQSAERLLILLCHCAPKNGAAAEWTQLVSQTISSAHATLDQVFRGVIEDWTSTDPSFRSTATKNFSKPPGITRNDGLGLYEWSGMHAGSRRLVALIQLLQNAVRVHTVQSVASPLGSVLDLVTRLNSVVVPKGGKGTTVRLNSEASRDEYEELWSELPSWHVASLELLSTLVNRLSSLLLPEVRTVAEQLVWVFEAEHAHPKIRIAAYELTRTLMPSLGPSMEAADVKRLSQLTRACCEDLHCQETTKKPEKQPNTSKSTQKTNGATSMDVDSFLGSSAPTQDTSLDASKSAIRNVAHRLLPVLLQHLPASSIPAALRAQIDRTAILTQHKEAVLASVLNPAPGQPGQKQPASIMPFLAQAFPTDQAVEALLRPRMPVLHSSGPGEDGVDQASDAQDDSMDHEAAVVEQTSGSDRLKSSHKESSNEDVTMGNDLAAGQPGTSRGEAAPREALAHSTPVKRTLAELYQDEDVVVSQLEADDHTLAGAPDKRARLDSKSEQDIHLPSKATAMSLANSAANLGEAQVSGSHDHATSTAQSELHDGPDGLALEKPAQKVMIRDPEQAFDDCHSDDSEIPRINADLDTDEEEDEDEDEDTIA